MIVVEVVLVLLCQRLVLPVIEVELFMLVVGPTCDSGGGYYVSGCSYL